MATANPAVFQPVTPAAPHIDFETTKEIGYYTLVWRRFKSRKIAMLALIALGLLVFSVVVVPFLIIAPNVQDPLNAYLNPLTSSSGHFHLLGTDELGQDLLSRNLAGGRISLSVGFLAMFLTLLISTVLGAVSGFFGGAVDAVVTAITNAFLAVPTLLVLIIFSAAFGGTIFTVVVGIALVSWPTTARIVRSVVLSLREKEFVEAAEALGTPRWRIVTRHILPNALGTLVVSASLTIGAAIITESALSFLGVGIGAPAATWGNLLDTGNNAITAQQDFFYAFFPGMFILVTVLCFNYLGDALRDAFDPRALER